MAVLCVDPASAFTGGAVLGDRIRMREWYNHSDVFIRSLSTRGALGGLNAGIVEITDVLRASSFDHILIETVGVGQSEIEIASLADTTVVVQVPEGGDDIQTMKAGLMEIADIFVVNKCDRPGADVFLKNLHHMLHDHPKNVSIVKTNAISKQGMQELVNTIAAHSKLLAGRKDVSVLMKRALQVILKNKMKQVDTVMLQNILENNYQKKDFNFYKVVSAF